ncbi:MAG: efflux RND transporter periplasmic adaptor subunit [Oscillospiraceae bacterium]|nr:efflux RND transporter periplasmic adaptor subunit [Oscillospiraceae bacterium]
MSNEKTSAGLENAEATGGGKKKKGVKIIVAIVLTLAVAVGVYFGIQYFAQSARFVVTENARITTNFASIVPAAPGRLERFTLYEGRRVLEDEVLGWVEGGASFRSPFDGIVVRSHAEQGHPVSPLGPIAVIADLSNLHIQANIEETYITRIALGQQVTVTIDAFGSTEFNGYVAEIGRVTDAELTGNVMFFNTGGTFTKVTALVPVRIHITDYVNLEDLIGLNVIVRIPLDGEPVSQPVQFVNRISSSGTVESASVSYVHSMLGLIIDDVAVEVGDRVSKGQVLAVFDIEELELSIAQAQAGLELARLSAAASIDNTQQMLNLAQANLRGDTNMHVVSAQAAVSAAQSNLEALQNNLETARSDRESGNSPQVIAAQAVLRNAGIAVENSKTDFENARFLYETGTISQLELRLAQDALTMAENSYADAATALSTAITALDRTIEQLEISVQAAGTAYAQALSALSASRNAARQDVEMLQSNVELAQVSANLEAQEIALRILERRLDDSKIIAPAGGTVTQLFAHEGMMGSGLMFVIEDTQDLRVVARFREYDIGLIYEGMEVEITSDVTGSGVYAGRITAIRPTALPSMGMAGGVVEFEAEVAVISASTSLKIGMSVRVNLEI